MPAVSVIPCICNSPWCEHERCRRSWLDRFLNRLASGYFDGYAKIRHIVLTYDRERCLALYGGSALDIGKTVFDKSKNHVSYFISRLEDHLKSKGREIRDWMWIREFHKDGVQHFHVLVSLSDIGMIGSKEITRIWGRGNCWEYYFKSEKHWRDFTGSAYGDAGYFAKNGGGYFDSGTKEDHQITLPEWALDKERGSVRKFGAKKGVKKEPEKKISVPVFNEFEDRSPFDDYEASRMPDAEISEPDFSGGCAADIFSGGETVNIGTCVIQQPEEFKTAGSQLDLFEPQVTADLSVVTHVLKKEYHRDTYAAAHAGCCTLCYVGTLSTFDSETGRAVCADYRLMSADTLKDSFALNHFKGLPVPSFGLIADIDEFDNAIFLSDGSGGLFRRYISEKEIRKASFLLNGSKGWVPSEGIEHSDYLSFVHWSDSHSDEFFESLTPVQFREFSNQFLIERYASAGLV